MNSRTTGNGSIAAVVADGTAADAIEADQLVEDVSIDGMCGVY